MPDRAVAIYGAGAVGGYLGARLASDGPAGATVTLVARPRVAEAVRAHGLRVRELAGERMVHPAATESARELPPQDLILLTVRAYDVAAAIDDLRQLLDERGMLIAFQNGVGTEEELATALGHERVLAGTLTVSAGMEEPGVVTRYSRGGGVALATMNGSPVPAWIVGMFQATGLPTVTVADYRSLRWSKLLLNMLTAATSAILDIDIDRLVRNPRVFRIEQLAFREATRVMDARGIRTVDLPGYATSRARLAMRLPRRLAHRTLGPRIIAARSGRSSGMRAEMGRGRSEVTWYNGAIARAGAEAGVPTPVNQALAELVGEMVHHPQLRDRYRGKPELLVEYLRERGIRL